MDSRKIIEDIEKRILETRNLTLAIQRETLAWKDETKEIKKNADAAWELVEVVREEMKQMRKPFWKRWFR